MTSELDNEVDRTMALAREWDELVEHVRSLDGFQDFLRPPKVEALQAAASGGPVVIVNVSRWRCDALIVTEDGVQVRELPDLTLDAASSQANRYLEILQASEAARADHWRALELVATDSEGAARRALRHAAAEVMAAEARTDEMLQDLQGWMWDSIAEPVLAQLGIHGWPGPGVRWPRLWWCPTGPLALLPLHTAGYHVTAGSAVPRAVVDRVVSSYTPTLRALLEAQRMPEGESLDAHRMLIVAVDAAPGAPRLRGVATERDTIASRFPADRLTVLDGAAATLGAVAHELPRHRWVQFSCHGDQNLTEPSEGGLLLHDGVLTVADIAARRFGGELAGLSACKTAVGGVALLDESITLAAALHYTGFRHVVAALWSVDDAVSAAVFDDFYARIVVDGEVRAAGAAEALHHAVRALRDQVPGEPRIWTPFTHTGP